MRESEAYPVILGRTGPQFFCVFGDRSFKVTPGRNRLPHRRPDRQGKSGNFAVNDVAVNLSALKIFELDSKLAIEIPLTGVRAHTRDQPGMPVDKGAPSRKRKRYDVSHNHLHHSWHPLQACAAGARGLLVFICLPRGGGGRIGDHVVVVIVGSSRPGITGAVLF
jgi:hypothetical protein